jgi:nucleotide-binding universal stress UspA family protein
MASPKRYLVPIDFSPGSLTALRYAVRLARENRGKLFLVHVVPPLTYPTAALLPDHFAIMKKKTRKEMQKAARRHGLRADRSRLLVVEREDVARAITALAKKFRVTMIVMGSHGRTGLERMMLGSVAERTLRYSSCPVLIVKK